MKVCVAGLRGFPGVMGGVERHCEELYGRASTLMARDVFIVFARAPYVPGERRRLRPNLVMVPIWAIKNKYFEAFFHTTLAIFLAKFEHKAGIVHIHAIGPGLAVPLAKILGMKVIFTHHGTDYDREKWNPVAKTALRMGEWLAVRFADQVICVSESDGQKLRARFPRKKRAIRAIPNGISTELLKALPEPEEQQSVLQSWGLSRGRYVLTVGRLVPEKGIHQLIAAFKPSEALPKLVIVGATDHPDGYTRKLLEQGSDSVIFTGFQSGARLASLYAGAGLFVLPSHHEGLPIVALEALSFDLNVLLSDIGANLSIGLAEVCYFKTGNVEDLRDKLSQSPCQFRPDSKTVLERFDWDEISRSTCDLISSLPAAQ